MTGVSRTCADTIKRSRQNVAIATQVLSPSAIGGSLRGQRRLKHFGPPDDDEEEFISYRRRVAWRKLGSYGISIFAVILLLMGVILAVGYFQTKKPSRDSFVVTRSVKLVQEGKPSSYIYTRSSTPETMSIEPTDPSELSPTAESSFLRLYANNDEASQGGGVDEEEDLYFPSSKEDDSGKVPGDYLVSYQANPHTDNDQPFYNDADSVRVGAGGENSKMPAHTIFESAADNKTGSFENELAQDNEVETGSSTDEVYTFPQGDPGEDTITGTIDDVPQNGKVLNEDSTFTLEIPIYSPNKSLDSPEPDQKDTAEVVLTKKLSTFPENSDKDEEDKSGGVEIVYTPNEKSTGFKNDDNFHKTILQTALFRLDEDLKEKTTSRPKATTIIIEDQGSEESSDSERLTSSSNFTSRNHKLTMLQNDKVMNMKSTYTPDRSKSLPSKMLESVVLKEKVDNVDDADEETRVVTPLRKKNRMEVGGNNKQEWKLKLRVNKDDNKVSLLGTISPTQYPNGELTSSTENVYASEEKPRGFSSKLPSFEDFLKAILSNVQMPQKTGKIQINHEFQMPPIPRPTTSHASEYGLKLANNLDAILPLTTSPPPQNPGGLQLDPTQFRKRTFITDNDHLIPSPIHAASQSPPEAYTYFDHLLGQNPTVGGIGSMTAAGATLGNFPTLSAFQSPLLFPTTPTFSTGSSSQLFENLQPSSTSDVPRLVPGVIPLNLASSYALVGQQQKPQSGQQSGLYGYPNSYDNFASFSSPAFTLPGSQPTGSPNFQTGLDNVGSLTTAGGQPPTYNSIAQGIHLLNLISGTFPNTYFHDQVYQPSTLSTPTTFQNDALSFNPFPVVTPPTNNFGVSSEAPKYNNVADILNSIPHPEHSQYPSPFPPSSFEFHSSHNSPAGHIFTGNHAHQTQVQPTLSLPLASRVHELQSDREKVEKFLEEEEEAASEPDQVPAASSFSQNILTTFKRAKTSNHQKSSKTHKPRRKPSNTPKPPTAPTSFTFEILPTKNSSSSSNPKSPQNTASILDPQDALNLTNHGGLLPSSIEETRSPSKKKSGAGLSIQKKQSRTSKSLHLSNSSNKLINPGLKSGFFT